MLSTRHRKHGMRSISHRNRSLRSKNKPMTFLHRGNQLFRHQLILPPKREYQKQTISSGRRKRMRSWQIRMPSTFMRTNKHVFKRQRYNNPSFRRHYEEF